MSRTSFAVWLATPALLASAGLASAYTYPPSEYTWGCNNGRSCGANITAFFNQHGPLFNYGPYYGYPPFDPYGPWNAYLQYNPWYYGYGNRGGGGCIDRDLSGHGPCCTSGASWHSSWGCGGWFHGCSTCGTGGIFTGHGGWFKGQKAAPSCDCGIAGSVTAIGAPPKAAFAPGTDPITRCAGVGNPAEFSAFYSGLPTLDVRLAR
jgi:hypothetical protein